VNESKSVVIMMLSPNTETMGLSVGTVAASIIAADFCAVPTDRPLVLNN